MSSQRLAGVLALLVLIGGALAFRGRSGENTEKKDVKRLRFVVYGDTRDGHVVHRKLVALIRKETPDLVLHTGDLVHTGSDNNLWNLFDGITGEMRRQIPFYPARGNHDQGGGGYASHVTAPYLSGNRLYYAFEKGNCHFVSLDSLSSYAPGSPQYQWLEKDLDAAQKTAQHIFVFFHYPPYSIGSHGSDLKIRAALCPLFQKYGVRAVFNGHDHNYYRTRRDGIVYVVSGGGGAPLYPCDSKKGAIEGDHWQSVNHIVVCDVEGEKITLHAIRSDGSVLDTFSFGRQVAAQ